MRITHCNAHIEKVNGYLIARFYHQLLPMLLVTMGMVNHQKISLGSMQLGSSVPTLSNNPIMALQSPYRCFKTSFRTAFGSREKNFGVKSVDKGRVQIKLRFGVQEML